MQNTETPITIDELIDEHRRTTTTGTSVYKMISTAEVKRREVKNDDQGEYVQTLFSKVIERPGKREVGV